MNTTQCRIQELELSGIRNNNLLSISIQDKDVDRCTKAIRKYGLLNPLVVHLCEDGSHRIIAGECELLALREMDTQKTEAVVVDCLNPTEANKLSLLLSSLRQSPNPLSEGLILRELLKSAGHTQVDIAYLVGKSASWVCKRLALVERLKDSVVQLVASKNLCCHTAQEIARLPLEEQLPFASKVVMDGLPKSAVEKLVSAYHRPGVSNAVKKSILDNPRVMAQQLSSLYPKIEKTKKSDTEQPNTQERLQGSLRLFVRLLGELELTLASLEETALRRCFPLLKPAGESAERFSSLVRAFHTRFTEVSPGKVSNNQAGGEDNDH